MPNPHELLIDGRRTLLVQEEGSSTRVAQYTAGEMLELFSAEEIGTISRGEHVVLFSRLGAVRYTDMVACTLLALQVQL